MRDEAPERHSISVVNEHVGRRLLKLRMLRGMRASEFEKILKVSPARYASMEHGRVRLVASQLGILARATGVDVSWFFEGLPEVIDQTSEVPSCSTQDNKVLPFTPRRSSAAK
jgi:transcriptional regulator with XRE-family HTH domain